MKRPNVRNASGAGPRGRIRFRALCCTAAIAASSLTNVGAADAHVVDAEVIARHSGKCLDVAHASQNHAASVVQGTCWGGENQQWTLHFAGSDWLGDYFSLVVRHSGKCLDVADASRSHAAPVVQARCWGGANQQWYLHAHGNDFWHITARHSLKCLDVAYASQAHAASVVQATCWEGANQEWTFSAQH